MSPIILEGGGAVPGSSDDSFGICSAWASEADLCAPCTAYEIDSALIEEHLLSASELLYQLSGQQFPGTCQETVAPCSQIWSGHPTSFEPYMTAPLTRFLHPQAPFPWTGCGHPSPCSCPGFPAIRLPRDNISEVTAVTVDDTVYLPEDDVFELQDSWLLRIDGDRWPTCDSSFRVTYLHGTAPPISGVRAAAVLACELLLACDPLAAGDGVKCRLPRNISAISRQGVSVIFERLTRSKGPFRFGIWEIDVFLEAFNPYGNTAKSVIISPDTIDLARRVP